MIKDDESLPDTLSSTLPSVITSASRHWGFLGLLLRHMWRAFLWHCGLGTAPKSRVPGKKGERDGESAAGERSPV